MHRLLDVYLIKYETYGMKLKAMFLMSVLGKENFSDNLRETEKSSHEVKVRCGIGIFVILKAFLPSMVKPQPY